MQLKAAVVSNAESKVWIDRPYIQGYELIDVVGEGASSIVFRGVQCSVGRLVAVKILRTVGPSDGQVESRFVREAQIIGRLRHPNTIRLYDAGRSASGELFLVTELLVGSTLFDLMRSGRMAIDRVLEICGQIAGALAEAHSAHVIHRDIKPANIFIETVGSETLVKVLDFGIAREEQSIHVTQPNIIVGSPGYMAPEQIMGEELDHRADIYALGVLLHNLLSGRALFKSATIGETMALHVTVRAPDLWSDEGVLDPKKLALRQLVRSMLEKDRDARPQTMIEVRTALDSARATRSEPVSAVPSEPVPLVLVEPLPTAEDLWFAEEQTQSIPREVVSAPRLREAGFTMLSLAIVLAALATMLAQ